MLSNQFHRVDYADVEVFVSMVNVMAFPSDPSRNPSVLLGHLALVTPKRHSRPGRDLPRFPLPLIDRVDDLLPVYGEQPSALAYTSTLASRGPPSSAQSGTP